MARPAWMIADEERAKERDDKHNAAARTVNYADVAFTVEVYLGGCGGEVPLVRSDGDHRSVPLGRYACIKIPEAG